MGKDSVFYSRRETKRPFPLLLDMAWIHRLFTPPPTPPSPSFRIRIKLTSAEATRRLRKIRTGLGLSKRRVTKICRAIKGDGTLQQQLYHAKKELSASIRLLEASHVGEREYLGSTILLFEALLRQTKQLLARVNNTMRTVEGVPSLCGVLAGDLARQIREARAILGQMRQSIREETKLSLDVAKIERPGMWVMRWFRALVRGKAQGRGRKEDHHDREHLFTGHAYLVREGCRCLDYR